MNRRIQSKYENTTTSNANKASKKQPKNLSSDLGTLYGRKLGTLYGRKGNARIAFSRNSSDMMNASNSLSDGPSIAIRRNISNSSVVQRNLPHISTLTHFDDNQRSNSKLHLKCILKNMFDTLKRINRNNSDKMVWYINCRIVFDL